jgi:DNA-binding PadR family transcriptional regulator
MFSNRFAYGWQGNGDEGGAPSWQEGHGPFWHHHHHLENDWMPTRFRAHGHGPHFFAMRRGRGPFGFGGGFGPGGGPFGPGREGGRFFGRGDMKYALLWLLQERPMHGYEMIKALEQRSGGFYSPSPGSIYPTLQMLEEGGFVTSNEVEGKKVYTITDTGRTLLTDNPRNEEGFAGPPWTRWQGRGERASRPEMHALAVEAGEVGRLFAIATRASFNNPEQIKRLRGIIERTRGELNALIANEPAAPAPDQPAPPPMEQA